MKRNLWIILTLGLLILALGAGTVLATLLVGALASAWSAWRLSRTDAGITLREGA